MKALWTFLFCGVLLTITACTPAANRTFAPPAQELPQPAAASSGNTQVAAKIPILMYHSISETPKHDLRVPPRLFEQQLQHLKEAGYQTLSFKELEDWTAGKPLPAKPVVITLDDGYRDNYTAAFPILKKLNMKATVFMTIDHLDQETNLTAQMIKEMHESGFVEFGSHALTHVRLTEHKDNDRLRAEIVQSKYELEKLTGAPVTSFCYPYGAYNEQALAYVKEAGYKFAVAMDEGVAELSQGVYTLLRIYIPSSITMDQFKKMFP